jgi:N-formylglutamate amidohydrolase
LWRAIEAGATAFVARVPRAEIDLNRDEREIDPALIDPPLAPRLLKATPRSKGGIGLVPSRIAGIGAIWNARLKHDELKRRIEQIHRPYHRAIARALEQARESFGTAVLLDDQSMPPRAPGEAQLVFGDRYGATAEPGLVQSAVVAARAAGYRTACNAPYAGGYVIDRHGRAGAAIQALQVEIDRSTYLDVELSKPGPGFAKACELITLVCAALETHLLGDSEAIAAE